MRLQHPDGSFESSSQQNSAPGQAIIGSHADGNTAARLVKTGYFLEWVDIPVLQTFPHSVLFPGFTINVYFSPIGRAGMRTYRLGLCNFLGCTLMDMASLNLANDIDYSTFRCVLAHSKCFLVGPGNMVSRSRQMFRRENSKMLPVARFLRVEAKRLPILCCALPFRLDVASCLKVAWEC